MTFHTTGVKNQKNPLKRTICFFRLLNNFFISGLSNNFLHLRFSPHSTDPTLVAVIVVPNSQSSLINFSVLSDEPSLTWSLELSRYNTKNNTV